jgi:hypothetical protein
LMNWREVLISSAGEDMEATGKDGNGGAGRRA